MYEPNTGTDFAYRTMPGVIELSLGNADTANAALMAATSNAVRTALILGAIALGIAAPRCYFSVSSPWPDSSSNRSVYAFPSMGIIIIAA